MKWALGWVKATAPRSLCTAAAAAATASLWWFASKGPLGDDAKLDATGLPTVLADGLLPQPVIRPSRQPASRTEPATEPVGEQRARWKGM